MRVPAAKDLVASGSAEVVERNRKGEAMAYRIKKSGYEQIYSAMKHNARLLRGDIVLRRRTEIEAIERCKKNGEGDERKT